MATRMRPAFGRLLITGFGTLATLGCGPVPISEIQRTPNGALSLDVVCAEKGTDATVATPTEVYILPHGHKITGEPIFRADLVEGIKATWKTDLHIIISARKARVYKKFMPPPNFTVKGVNGQSFVVRIDLAVEALESRRAY